MFLVYIHDSSDGFQCNSKLSANDISLFAIVQNINKAINDLSNDLTKITQWAFQWKISFYPDISKRAHEDIFSCKSSIECNPLLAFNNIPVTLKNSQNHLGMQLDNKQNFGEYMLAKLNKAK